MKTAATIFNTSGGVVDASSSVEDLLAHVKTLSLSNQRAVSAVVRVASFTTHTTEYKKVNQLVSIFFEDCGSHCNLTDCLSNNFGLRLRKSQLAMSRPIMVTHR
jgi:hypothetical protein